MNAPITIESILGTSMTVEVIDIAQYGQHQAIIPRVSGNAWVTGRHRFLIDLDDPLRDGFLLKGQRPNVKP